MSEDRDGVFEQMHEKHKTMLAAMQKGAARRGESIPGKKTFENTLQERIGKMRYEEMKSSLQTQSEGEKATSQNQPEEANGN